MTDTTVAWLNSPRKCAVLVVTSLLLFLGSGSYAAQPPQYFIDQSKLPFQALPDAPVGLRAGRPCRSRLPDRSA